MSNPPVQPWFSLFAGKKRFLREDKPNETSRGFTKDVVATFYFNENVKFSQFLTPMFTSIQAKHRQQHRR